MLKLLLSSVVFAIAMPAAAQASEVLEVVGTGDGMALVRSLGHAYSDANPATRVVVPPSIGSGGGIAAVGSGKALLARVARPLKTEERAMGLVSRALFRLPTAIYAHGDLTLDALSHSQLVDIFIGKVTNWAQVGGPDLRIRVVRREDTDSSLSVLRNSMPGWSDLAFTSRAKTAVTTQDAVETVKANRGAIGFGPYSRQLDTSTNVLRIGGLHPTDANYPSAVTVSFVWHQSRLTETVASFVNFSYSQKARSFLLDQGAVPSKEPQLTMSN